MRPLIRTYENFQKALGVDQRYTIVNKGVSRFIPAPVAPADHAELLTSLGLELADRGRVANINKAFKDMRTDWTADLASVASRMRSSKKIGGRPEIYKGVVQVLECGLFYYPEDICVIDKTFVTDNFSMHSSNYILEEIGVAIVNKKEYEHKYPTWSKFSIYCNGQKINTTPVVISDSKLLKGHWKENVTKVPEYTVTLELDPEMTSRLRKELAALGNSIRSVRTTSKPVGTCLSDMSNALREMDKEMFLAIYGFYFDVRTGHLEIGRNYQVRKGYEHLFYLLASSKLERYINQPFTPEVMSSIQSDLDDVYEFVNIFS